eukprot:5803663-Prymnesium_polylepis.2
MDSSSGRQPQPDLVHCGMAAPFTCHRKPSVSVHPGQVGFSEPRGRKRLRRHRSFTPTPRSWRVVCVC